MNNVGFALLLTLFAGLSTGIGSLIALFAKRTNTRFLSVSLGFSAGVMIYVSMIEIFAKARESLSAVYGAKLGYVAAVLSFFGGMILIALIDKLIPSGENPHEAKSVEAMHG
ncbi:MAG: zinc transporter ZupT, partial [Oscillospiraceae bacterium]